MDDQDSCANDAESAEVTGRRSNDQLTPSHGVEWYDLSDHAEKCWRFLVCKHQRGVICSFSSQDAGEKLFVFQTRLLIPLGYITFCFVCLHLKCLRKRTKGQKKIYTATCPKSEVNGLPLIFQCSVPPLCHILPPEKDACVFVAALFSLVILLQLQITSVSFYFSPFSAVITDHTAAQALYSHGMCNWPGCETVCENLNHFVK